VCQNQCTVLKRSRRLPCIFRTCRVALIDQCRSAHQGFLRNGREFNRQWLGRGWGLQRARMEGGHLSLIFVAALPVMGEVLPVHWHIRFAAIGEESVIAMAVSCLVSHAEGEQAELRRFTKLLPSSE